jgi:hypothetical protein
MFFGEETDSSLPLGQSDPQLVFRESIEEEIGRNILEEILKKHGDLPLPPQEWPVWNSVRESRHDYIARIKRGVLNAIETNSFLSQINNVKKRGLVNSVIEIADQYCDAIKEHHEQAIQPASLSRNIERDLIWSIKFQVVGMTYTAITHEYELEQTSSSGKKGKSSKTEGVNLTTVKRSVEKTLKLIKLNKRPDSGRGRPRHSKDSYSTQITRRLGSE